MELNHRHTDFQSVALPTELSGPFKERLCKKKNFFRASKEGQNGAVGGIRTINFIRTSFKPIFTTLLP